MHAGSESEEISSARPRAPPHAAPPRSTRRSNDRSPGPPHASELAEAQACSWLLASGWDPPPSFYAVWQCAVASRRAPGTPPARAKTSPFSSCGGRPSSGALSTQLRRAARRVPVPEATLDVRAVSFGILPLPRRLSSDDDARPRPPSSFCFPRTRTQPGGARLGRLSSGRLRSQTHAHDNIFVPPRRRELCAARLATTSRCSRRRSARLGLQLLPARCRCVCARVFQMPTHSRGGSS